MLRINGRTCECGERLELVGRLTTPHVPELEKAVVEAFQRSPRVALDLCELTYLDADGARVLRELRRQDVSIHGCSAFVAELLGLSGSGEREPGGGPCWS